MWPILRMITSRLKHVLGVWRVSLAAVSGMRCGEFGRHHWEELVHTFALIILRIAPDPLPSVAMR